MNFNSNPNAQKALKIFFMAAIAMCLILPFFSYSKPLLDVDTVFENAAYAINTIGLSNLARQYYWDAAAYTHPPAYILTLSLFCKIFGLNLTSVRLVGFASILIMALLIYFLSQKLFQKEKDSLLISLLGVFLYLSVPLIIQGSVFIDIDNTILPVSMAIFVIAYIHLYREMSAKRIIILGCLFALTLWVKITTSLILVPAIGIFYLLKRDFKEAIKSPILIFLIGAAIFLVTFSLHCIFIDSWKPFKAIPLVFSVALIKKPAGTFYFKLYTMSKAALRLSMWLSPYLIFLWLISLKDSFKRICKGSTIISLDFLSVYSCLIFLGYLYFGGSHVLSKYHIPMVFAVCILVVNSLKEALRDIRIKEGFFCIALILILGGYYIFIVKDIIYLANYKLKVALAFDNLNKNDLLFFTFKQILFYFLPMPVVFYSVRAFKSKLNLSKVILLTLFVLTISSNLGLDILQAKADYVTAEFYGTKGQQEVISFLKNHIDFNKGIEIMAPEDINYYLGKRDFPMDPYMELGLKYDAQKLLSALNNKRVKAFIYNIPQFTVWQIRDIFGNKDVQKLLNEEFIKFSFKSYRVWLRKD